MRDRSLVAPIATGISGGEEIAFVAFRMCEAYVREEWQWAGLCAVVALVRCLSESLEEPSKCADLIPIIPDVVNPNGRLRVLQYVPRASPFQQ